MASIYSIKSPSHPLFSPQELAVPYHTTTTNRGERRLSHHTLSHEVSEPHLLTLLLVLRFKAAQCTLWKELPTLFRMHKLTDARDWLQSL